MASEMIAPAVKEDRQPASEGNLFKVMEKTFSENMVTMLNAYRNFRDSSHEMFFKSIYENPWIQMMFSPPQDDQDIKKNKMEEKLHRDAEVLRASMGKGGYPEAIVRILLAIMTADQELTRAEYARLETVVQASDQMKQLSSEKLRETIREQSRLLQVDRDESLKTLPALIPDKKDRSSAINVIGNYIQAIKRPLKTEEQIVLTEIEIQLNRHQDDHQ
jgi:hypothetical protein